MPRYAVSRQTGALWTDDEYSEPLLPNLHVDGPGATDTGLVDIAERPIVRLANPIGFHAEID